MPNIEDFETPEALVEAAVRQVRMANGVKVFVLPAEATEAQREALARELQTRHPWHTIICVTWHGKTDDGGFTPPDEPTHSLEALRRMLETPESLGW